MLMEQNTRFYELVAEKKGYFYTRKGGMFFPTPPHFHSSIELLFCMEGSQEVSISGKKYLLKKGSACFVDSYAVHSIPKGDCKLYVFLGDLQFFQPVFHAFGDRIPPVFFNFDNESLLSFLQDVCKNAPADPNVRYEMHEGAIKLLLSEIAKTVPFVPRKENRQADLVASILRYASDNLNTNLSLKELSVRFGYSHEHLSRILHRHLGEHWNVYIGRLRVRATETLLKSNPHSSVLELAARCGFDSPNTFYRAYQREYGKPPRK